MPIANAKHHHKTSAKSPAVVVPRTFSTHEELLEDMDAFRERVLATPGAAREFLIRAGLLTKTGKTKQLIRD